MKQEIKKVQLWILFNKRFCRSRFNGDLSSWDLRNCHNMIAIFRACKIDTENIPWWYLLKDNFKSLKLMWESNDEWNWIDWERKIIWKRRLNRALMEGGKDDLDMVLSNPLIGYKYF